MSAKRKNKILVCVDFQEQSLIALHQCYDLARFLKAEVVLLYVIESNDFFSGFFAPNIDKVKNEVEERLVKLVEELKTESGLEFSYAIETGKAYERIVFKAEEIKARFIVMGKNGSNQGIKRFLGSNTIHVISESNCPVISVKGKHSIGYKNIVLPLDLTKRTREKVASAISFSRFFGSHVHVVSVLTGGIIIQKSRIYKRMKKVQRELEQNGVGCTLKLYKKSKTPDYGQVISYCNEINADLVMIMTHQEGKVSDYYIGSFAHHIINESEIPVLSIIPSRSSEDDESIIEAMVDPFDLIK
jgi:nucleotide-binding universal stress UspA family protein